MNEAFDRNALARMRWAQLLELRKQHADPQTQNLLADYEHRAYAREDVADDPWKAPFYAAMVPGYQALKLLRGGQGSRSDASWRQLGQGLIGAAEGVAQAWRR